MISFFCPRRSLLVLAFTCVTLCASNASAQSAPRNSPHTFSELLDAVRSQLRESHIAERRQQNSIGYAHPLYAKYMLEV